LKQQSNPFYQEYNVKADILTAFMRKHTTVWQQYKLHLCGKPFTEVEKLSLQM